MFKKCRTVKSRDFRYNGIRVSAYRWVAWSWNATKNTAGFHVSFDLDGIDPLYAPGVSTPVTGGISYREAHLMLEMMADTKKVLSMEFVELNPMCDENHKTAGLVIDLIQSTLGKSIV